MRDDRRQTAVHTAARAGATRVLEALLAAAAAAEAASPPKREPLVELRDRWHRTAIHWAVVNQKLEAVELLITAVPACDGTRCAARRRE